MIPTKLSRDSSRQDHPSATIDRAGQLGDLHAQCLITTANVPFWEIHQQSSL